MRVAILSNPASGKGHAAAVALEVNDALSRAGFATDLLAPADDLRAPLDRAMALAIIGGDGTVHRALPTLATQDRGVPIYHVPLGTENLFAREFGFSTRSRDVLRAVQSGRSRPIDLALAQLNAAAPTPFAIMLTMGPDASIVRRLARTRRGPISHRSYLAPILDEIMAGDVPKLTIDADGRRLATDRPGWLVIANMPQYALRVNPAHDARPDDGLLDLAFFPAETWIDALDWLLRARLRAANDDPRVLRAKARHIRVAAPADAAIQVDGEPLPTPAAAPFTLDVTIDPARLLALVPKPG